MFNKKIDFVRKGVFVENLMKSDEREIFGQNLIYNRFEDLF